MSDSGGIAIRRSRVESPVEVREVYERLRGSVRRVIVGKDRVVDLCLISLLAGGHVLLTDIPGVGKTTLARAISSSIAADFSRIQFTPDLLPSDITGTSIYDPGRRASCGCQAPSSRRSCWPMRSTAPPHERRARCWRRWRRAR